MKIPGSDSDTNHIKRLNDEATTERAKRGATPKRPESLSDALGQEGSASSSGATGGSGVGDRFISSKLGLKIREELDPAKMLQERRDKVARIKEQLRNGSYVVESDKVARSVGEEISLELLFSGGVAASE